MLPTAGDRTRTRRRDRCSDTSTNSVTLAQTMFGQILSSSNVWFRVARFAGGMAMCGRKRSSKDDALAVGQLRVSPHLGAALCHFEANPIAIDAG